MKNWDGNSFPLPGWIWWYQLRIFLLRKAWQHHKKVFRCFPILFKFYFCYSFSFFFILFVCLFLFLLWKWAISPQFRSSILFCSWIFLPETWPSVIWKWLNRVQKEVYVTICVECAHVKEQTEKSGGAIEEGSLALHIAPMMLQQWCPTLCKWKRSSRHEAFLSLWHLFFSLSVLKKKCDENQICSEISA